MRKALSGPARRIRGSEDDYPTHGPNGIGREKGKDGEDPGWGSVIDRGCIALLRVVRCILLSSTPIKLIIAPSAL